MDPRDPKPRDFVAAFRNLTEDTRRSRSTHIEWLRKYELLLKEHDKLGHEIRLYKGRDAAIKKDVVAERERTCLPMPITTNGKYGWLSTKPEFCLEKYGLCVINYPNPLKGIIIVSGNIPTLAAGKGLFW